MWAPQRLHLWLVSHGVPKGELCVSARRTSPFHTRLSWLKAMQVHLAELPVDAALLKMESKRACLLVWRNSFSNPSDSSIALFPTSATLTSGMMIRIETEVALCPLRVLEAMCP
jgi:hypothetical protein